MSKVRSILVIPTYNCQDQIVRLLEKSKAIIENEFKEVLIIDNGSTDSTIANAIKNIGSYQVKIKILQNLSNMGLGGTLKTGFLYAIRNSFDYVAVLHGDDQASIGDMLPTLRSLETLGIDMAVGARFHDKSKLIGYSLFRRIGNRTLNVYCMLCTRKKIDDLIAGLNIFRVSALPAEKFLSFPNDLTFDVHLLLSAIHENKKIHFFPITWIVEDQISNAKVIRQAWIIVRLFTKYLLNPAKVFSTRKSMDSYDSYKVIFER